MISITITEKLWDGIRPGSVKKTGLSEAIRAFAKANKGSPDTPKAYDDMIAAVGTLGTAIGKAEDAVKKAKDDKKGAAARLKTWKQECDKASGQLAAERKQLGLLKASKEADDSLKELAKQVDEAIKDAGQMLKDMESGALKDSKKISSGLQDLRGVVRNGLKATQKDGFVAYIRTFKQIMDWGVKPEDVPLPPNAKSIKEKMPTLEEAVEKVRVKAEELLEEAAKGRTGEAADLAQDLIADYRKMKENIKAFIPAAKKFGTDTKVLGDRFKELIGKGTPYTKLLELVQVMHGKIMTFEEKTLTEIARAHRSGRRPGQADQDPRLAQEQAQGLRGIRGHRQRGVEPHHGDLSRGVGADRPVPPPGRTRLPADRRLVGGSQGPDRPVGQEVH